MMNDWSGPWVVIVNDLMIDLQIWNNMNGNLTDRRLIGNC